MKRQVIVLILLSVVAWGCHKQEKPQVAEPPPLEVAEVRNLERIHFDFDKSDIKEEFKSVLEENANVIKEKNTDGTYEVVIEGHCDERGTEEYNVALGYRRAQATKDYIVALGVGENVVLTRSFGEERPLETCQEETCWQKNRRADFVRKK